MFEKNYKSFKAALKLLYISTKACDIFEELILNFANILTKPTRCKFGFIEEKSDRMYLSYSGITLEDAKTLVAFFKNNGDNNITFKEEELPNTSKFYYFDVDMNVVANLIPEMIKRLSQWHKYDPELIAHYQEKCKTDQRVNFNRLVISANKLVMKKNANQDKQSASWFSNDEAFNRAIYVLNIIENSNKALEEKHLDLIELNAFLDSCKIRIPFLGTFELDPNLKALSQILETYFSNYREKHCYFISNHDYYKYFLMQPNPVENKTSENNVSAKSDDQAVNDPIKSSASNDRLDEMETSEEKSPRIRR